MEMLEKALGAGSIVILYTGSKALLVTVYVLWAWLNINGQYKLALQQGLTVEELTYHAIRLVILFVVISALVIYL